MNKNKIRRKYVEIVATTLHVNNQRHRGVTPPESLTDGWERAYNGTPPSELPKYAVELNFFRNEVDFTVGMLMQVLDSQLRDNHANSSESHQEPVAMCGDWVATADRLPPPETPVLAFVHGMDIPIILEMRWETCNPMIEPYFKKFLYWDDPHNDGQDYEDRVFAWQPLPEYPRCT